MVSFEHTLKILKGINLQELDGMSHGSRETNMFMNLDRINP